MAETNALEILISARDDASRSLAVVSKNIGGIGLQADISADKILRFGSSLVKATNDQVITKFQQISGAIIDIGQKAPSALASTARGFLLLAGAIQSNSLAIEAFKNGIEFLEKDLIGTKRSLVDIKDALIDTGKLFSGLNFGDRTKNNFISTIKEIEAVAVNANILKASEVIREFANELSFKAGQKTGQFFTDIADGFDLISEKVTATAGQVRSFVGEQIDKTGFTGVKEAEKFINSPAVQMIGVEVDFFVGNLPKEVENVLNSPAVQMVGVEIDFFVNKKIEELGIGEDLKKLGKNATDIFDRVFSGFFQGTKQATQANVKEIEGDISETLQTSLGRKLVRAGLDAGQKIASGIGGAVNSTLNGIDKLLDNIETRVDKIKNVQQYSGYIQQVTLNPAGLPGAEELGKLKEEAAGLLGVLGNVGQEFFFLTYGVQQLAAVFSGPYEAFIGQNVKLQEILLATQSQIVATNKIFKNGIEITNATEGIKSLGETSKRTIDRIRTDSLALVGVTSQDLIQQLLPVVTRNLAQLGGQLGDVPGLVTSLGASLGTLGLPLYQASQELTSIATGTIDVNSQLAKSLNLTNAQVQLFKQQGRLIPELTARLQPFVEGNALAAQTIGGVFSNLQEVFQLVTQKSGESFLDPIVKRLGDVYKLVDPQSSDGAKNFQALQELVTGVAKNIFDGIVKLADGIGALLKSIAPAVAGFIQVGAKTIGDLIGFVGETLTSLANGPLKYLGAALGALSQYAEIFTGIFKIGLLLKIRDVIFGVAIGGFGILIKTLPIVGTLFGLFSLRSNEAVLALTNLRGASNTSVASLLTLGKNINSIPGAVEGVSKSIPIFGQSIGQILPQLSQFGIALIALGQRFPALGAIFKSLDTAIPKIVAGLANIAIAFLETSAAAVNAGKSIGVFGTIGAGLNTAPIVSGLKALTVETKISDLAVNTFGKTVGTLRKTIISSLFSFGASSLLFFGIFQLFEKFQPVMNKIGETLKPLADAFITFGQVVVDAIKLILPYLGYVIAGVGLLATALIKDLVGAIIATIATQMTGWLVATASLLGSLTTATVAAAGGATKLAVALRFVGAAEGVTALSRAFLVLGPIIAGTLLPLLAIVAAIASFGVIYRGMIQDDEISAVDTNRGGEQNANNTNFALLGRAKKAKEDEAKATASGIKLTKEQYAENAKLQKQIETQIASEKSRIAGLERELPTFKTDSEKEAQQGIIDRSKQTLKDLEEKTQNIAIAAKDLPQYGSAIEQFSRNVDNAKKALSASAGDPNVFKQQVQALLEGSQQLQDSGIINADEVVKTLKEIATNASIDADIQIKAQQGITDAYKKESQKRIDIYDNQLAKIQTLVATGKLSEAEAIAQTSKVTLDKLAEEQDAIDKAYLARQEINTKNAKTASDNAKQDQVIADAKIAAAKGDPTKLQEVKVKQLSDVDDKRKGINDELIKARAELKSLEDNNPVGLRNASSTSAIEEATKKVQGLDTALDKIDKYRGNLDKVIKIEGQPLKDLKDLPNQIKDARERLEEIKKEKALAISEEEKGRFNLESRTYGKRRVAQVKEKTQEEKDQQANISALESRLASAQKALTPDAKAEKNALGEKQSAIDAQGKIESNAAKFQQEEKRKRDKDIEAKQLEARKELATAQVRILDQQIKTSLDKEKVGEVQRLGELAKLRKSGIKLESEIRLAETGEKKKSIQLELDLQQQKLAQFAILEKKGVGVSQEQKLATTLKIAELTKSLSETELAAIDSLIAAIRDRLTLAANQYGVKIEQQNLGLEKQKLLYTALERSLANQNIIANSTKKLNDSVVAVREADLNVLTKIYDKQQQAIRDAGGAGNFADKELEEKKLLLAEQLAKIKLESLLRQQVFERESLEREIQKRDLLLERQKLENQMNLAKKKIDLAIGQADVKAAEAEVRQRPDSPEAKLKLDRARLEQQKKELEYAGLVQEGGFINETGRLNKDQAGQERETLQNTQFSQRTTANAEFASALTDPVLQEQLLQQMEYQTKQRAFGNQGQARITGDQARDLINTQIPTTQGASLTDPSKYADVLRRSERNPNGTLTTEPVKPVNNAFATSFDELQSKYPDKGAGAFATSFEELQRKYPDKGLGSIGDLNKKYGGKDATTFEELNAKYSGKPEVDPTEKIGSSFDSLTKQIDAGFTNVLIAPTMKVDEMTAGLEAQFAKVSAQIKENPVKIGVDQKGLDEAIAKMDKPLKVLDEDQLKRLEAVVGSLRLGDKNVDIKSAGTNAASAGATTINAPITVNSNGAGSSQDVHKVVNNALDNLLRKVANVTATTK
jgi:hypothetical protein